MSAHGGSIESALDEATAELVRGAQGTLQAWLGAIYLLGSSGRTAASA